MAFFNALLFHAKIYLNVYWMCVFFFLEYKMKLVNFVCTVRERSFGIANGQDKETCSRLFCFFFCSSVATLYVGPSRMSGAGDDIMGMALVDILC